MPFNPSRLTVDPNFADPAAVRSVFMTIYNGSSGAAAAIDAWLSANPTKNIEIQYLAGAAQSRANAGIVQIDPAFFNNAYYMSTNGRMVHDTFLSGLTHELGHAVTGKLDNDSFSDLAGDNVREVNTWFAELGLEKQASYNAYEAGSPHVPQIGKEYTNGSVVENVIIYQGTYSNSFGNSGSGFSFDTGNVDLTASGVSGSTLIVGGSDDNNYTGTSSNDWIYGGDGNDVLNGGEGDDTLDGEAGSDKLIGGAGNDILRGGDDGGVDGADYSTSTGGVTINLGQTTGTGSNAGLTVSDDGLGGHDSLIGIEKITLSHQADRVVVTSASLSSPAAQNLQTIDAGGGASDRGDILDMTGVSGDVNFEDDTINGSSLKFKNFDDFRFGNGDNTVDNAGDILGTYYMGAGDDTITRVGAGSVVYTGDGDDKIDFSPGAAIADLSDTDRIVLAGILTIHGGLRNRNSQDKWAEGLGGFVEYGLNQDGELVIRLPWLSARTVTGTNGQQVSIEPEMYITNFAQTMDGYTGAGDITLASYDIQVYRVYNAPEGVDSVASQMELLGLEIKTIAGTNSGLWHGQDPLVLDLDGDGLELTYRSSISKSFDLDADYYSEPAAWVLPDDGFLVRDINGDGKINDGTEMFSPSGSGFQSLGLLDGNGDGVVNAGDNGLADFNGDGVIDSSDTFSDLKVWVDYNQDAVTQATELHALSEYGIVGFNLTTTAVNSSISGNTVTETASFIRANGTTGTYGEVLLNVDNTNTKYVGPAITVTSQAQAEPDLKGYGTLVSLHEALSRHPEYIGDVNAALASVTTNDLATIKQQIMPVLYDWAMGSPVRQADGSVLEGSAADPRNNSFIAVKDYQGHYKDYVYESDTTTVTIGGVDHLDGVWKFASGARVEIIGPDTSALPDPTTLHTQYGDYTSATPENVTIDGQSVVQTTYTYANGAIVKIVDGPATAAVLLGDTTGGAWSPDLGPKIAFYQRYMGEKFELNVKPNGTSNLNGALAALDTLAATIDNSLNFLAVRLVIQDSIFSPIFSGMHYDVGSDSFVANGSQQLAPMYQGLFEQASLESDPIGYLASWKPFITVLLGNYSQGSDVRNTNGFLAQNAIGGFEAAAPSYDFLDAVDALGIARDLFVTGTDQMMGTNDADIFYINGTNQTAFGGTGVDNYIIGKHIGTTVIHDEEGGGEAQSEDVLRFTTLNVDDITATREGADLVMTVDATGETIRIEGQFTGPLPSLIGGGNLTTDYGVTEIVFADGTVWQKLQMAMAVARALPSGGTVEGTSATDMFISGPGDDVFIGHGSSDLYKISADSGNDEINDLEDILTRIQNDTVLFTGGLTADDLRFARQEASNDLTISFAGKTGSLKIDDQFFASNTGSLGLWLPSQIEVFAFDDGSMLTSTEIQDLTLATYETSGNDQVFGFYRDDTIKGGLGNDFLSGGDGNDTYVINPGDGNDEIDDASGNLLNGQTDTIAFGAGISRSDLTFTRSGASADLTIGIGSSGQSVKIDGQFTAVETGAYGAWYPDQIENITFSDGTSMTDNDIRLATIAGSETSGNDTIYGFHGDDTLQGGAGDDFMSGGDGNDTYVINTGDGHDEIDDASGNLLSGQNDTLSFGAGITRADVTFSRSGNSADLLVTIGTTGQTVKIDNQFFKTLNWWPSQIETFAFSDGTTMSYSDVMLAVIASNETAGNDTVYGFGTDDTLDAGAGDDNLYGGDGNDTYLFGRGYGSDTIGESNGTDTVRFKTGVSQSDLLVSRSGTDMIIKLKDPVTGLAGPDQLRISTQFDYWQNSPIEQFTFADAPGTVLTRDDLKNLYFQQAKTSGNDSIIGTQGSDTLAGGAGDDYLQGGDGDDTYIFNLGDGADTIYDFNGNLNYSSVDTLQLGAGITPANTTLIWQGSDLLIKVGSGNDSIRVQGYFDWNLKQIENISFADGTVWHQSDIATLVQNNPINGTTSGDTITGTIGPDTIDGLGGTDSVNGDGGADIFKFNSGYGQLTITQYDANKDSVLQLGSGIGTANVSVTSNGIDIYLAIGSTDLITLKNQYNNAHAGVGSVKFSNGTTWSRQDLITAANAAITYGTTGNDNITGTGGPNIFDGRGGTDYINGNDGNDTFLFNSGYGSLEIYEDDFWIDSPNTKLQFGVGINPSDVTRVTNDANGRITLFLQGNDKVMLDRMATGATTEYGVNKVAFADGTVWTRADVFAKAAIGTTGNDTIYGTGGNNVFDGKGGTDYIQGNDGNDTFIFNAGYGTLEIYEDDFWIDSPNTKLQLGAGINPGDITVTNDANGRITLTLAGTDKILIDKMAAGDPREYGVNSITFADGTVWTKNDVFAKAMIGTTANETLYGTRYGNVIDGKGGNDYLVGNGGNDSVGNDTFIFNQGYGNLEISEMDTASNKHNTLLFGTGINTTDIKVTGDGGNKIYLTNTVTGVRVQLDDEIGLDSSWYGVQKVQFADGTVWTRQDLITKETTGTTGNDSMYGTSAGNTFDGKGGNDYASGNGGNDSTGNDTFIFNLGYGNLEIREMDTAASKHNTLLLGAGINTGDIRVTADSSYRMFLTNTVNGDRIQLDDELGTDTSWYGVQKVQFADGTIWTRQDLINKAAIGTTGSDSLYGTTDAQTFDGKGGTDTATGNGGNDTFIFNSGYGSLTVVQGYSASSNPNTALSFGTSINPWNVTITKSGSDVYLADGVSGDQVKLKDQIYSSQAYGVGAIKFADGTKWDRGYIAGNQIVGTSGNNSLTGTSGADTIDGRGGSDTVVGGGGADRYAFDQGYGALTIDNGGTVGSAAHSELDFGGGIDQQGLWFVHSGNDLVVKRIGTSDQVTVSSWFGGDTSKQLADIKLSSGLQIDSQLNSLISAMATFAANNPSFDPATATAMPTDTTLQSAIAASWH